MHARHPFSRRSPVLLLVCLLGLGTGLALLGIAGTLSEARADPPAPTDAAALAVVDRFYDAANLVLTTGDAAELDAVLAPGFVDHAPAPNLAPDRAGLKQALVARHATFPAERLVVDHAVADGDEVVVRVHAEGAREGEFLGLPLPAEAGGWGPLEVFRVEGAAIAERWAGAARPLLAQPLWQMPCPAVGDEASGAVFALERSTYAPGEERVLGGDAAARIVFVEAGTLTAVGVPSPPGGGAVPRPIAGAGGGTAQADLGPTPAEPGRAAALVAGDLVAIPAMGRLTTRNSGDGTAVAVAVVSASPLGNLGGSPGQVRAATGIVVPPGAMLSAGRLVLDPGVNFSFPAWAGVVLAIVEDGQLEEATPVNYWRPVAAGETTVARPGDGGRWRAANGDPVVLLVVTIAPAGAADGFPQVGSAS